MRRDQSITQHAGSTCHRMVRPVMGSLMTSHNWIPNAGTGYDICAFFFTHPASSVVGPPASDSHQHSKNPREDSTSHSKKRSQVLAVMTNPSSSNVPVAPKDCAWDDCDFPVPPIGKIQSSPVVCRYSISLDSCLPPFCSPDLCA